MRKRLRPTKNRQALVATCATGLLSALFTLCAPATTQTAVANGDTRTIRLYHAHTKESITATFRVNGSYDSRTLDALNWFLRDWRRDEPIKMDARLFDVIWETYRQTGSTQPITIVSAYRSPATNAMLRRRSRAVAEQSQHMLGKAMDMHYADVSMSRVREIAMRLQGGGVGYYPTAGTPFVHLDVGSVRAWPRMGYDQLARLFPDGKTVHLPANGQPLARYEEARAEIAARGGAYAPTLAQVQSKGFFATLFGGGDDEEVAAPVITRGRGRTQVASTGRATGFGSAPQQMASADDGSNAASFFASDGRQAAPVARAQQNLPRGETYIGPAATPVAAAKPTPIPEPAQQVAALDPRKADEAVEKINRAVDLPLPPRRPSEQIIASLGPSAPLPPARPRELFASAAPAAAPVQASATQSPAEQLAAARAIMAHAGGLPSVITQGTGASAIPAGTLAYAAAPADVRPPVRTNRATTVGLRAAVAPAPRRTELVAARLDRANFQSLTSVQSVRTTMPQTTLGSSVAPLRAAARTDANTLMFSAPVASSSFNAADDLRSEGFTQPVKPQASADIPQDTVLARAMTRGPMTR